MKKVWALCLSACMAATPLLASAETAYTDGTYTAVKPGFGGDVTATVSVSDGKIDAVIARRRQRRRVASAPR